MAAAIVVTSPYERKILEWDDKPQTNKQTNEATVLITKTLILIITGIHKTFV